MLKFNKSILVYGLTEEELEKLKKTADLRVIEITSKMSEVKIKDILKGVKGNSEKELHKEKLVLFNNYTSNELPRVIRFIRNRVTGGILASVTPTNREWTLEYLLEHLIEEREWVEKNQKG